ncbi:O-antigen ligase family protein [Paenibacillus senegalimassiliensis]|uniref:O-antigen ligase family protein n=1 Tax=Paenibacillus senegalimassiliensis TaxID=1737426 RepID=UPI0012FD864D|nr:O-antigen ligase family protein [Paenibacillus senegalimassiliensis]
MLLHAAGAAGQGFLGRLLRPETGFARAVMYGDAVQLLRQAPWLGQGGDTWRHAFRSLQSTPYVGSEVHSGYLDLALDIGLPGLALVLLWLALQGVQLIRRRSAMLPSYVAILLHSAIDFDMSYGLIWLLLLWMAADAVRPGRFMISRKRPLRPAICLLAAVCLVLLGLSGLRQATSLKLYQQALSRYAAPSTEERRFEAASKLLRRALELAPYRNQARIALASRSNTTEKVSLLRQGLSYEPADARLWLALGRALAESNHAGTVPALRQAVALDRFDHKGQTMVLQEVLQLAQRLREQGQMQEALEVADAGLALYEEYAEQAEMMRLTLARNDRQFNLTGEAEEWGKKLQEISNSFSWNDHDQQVRR